MRMTRIALAMIGTIALLLFAGVTGRAQDSGLADGGKTAYRIVISKGADAGTKAVAEDFAKILTEMTGATFPVVTDDTEAGDNEIIVGEDNSRLAGLGLAGMTEGFAEGEYEIRTVGAHLVIAGAARRGTINGMYGFLQDHLGCRWFTPGCQYVPKKASVKLGDIRDRQKPAFRWRSTDSTEQWDANWVIRNRLNESKAGVAGGAPALRQVHGDPRSIGMTNCWRPHAFTDVPASLFEEHPEYYSEIGGKRVCDASTGRRAYCVTNEGFAKWVADWTKGKLRQDPKMEFVSITHADNHNLCRCKVCRASDKEVGVTGTYIRFGNRVAAEVVKEFPDARIITFAYGNTFRPSSVQAHPNLRICWCPIGADYAHALDEGEVNRGFDMLSQLAKWHEKSTQLGIWYYQIDGNTLMPRLMLHPTQRNLRIFRDRGVDQIFVEMNFRSFKRKEVSDGDKFLPAYANAKEHGWFIFPYGLEHVRSYIYARLLWNPDFDIAEGIREFCEVYYGDAGGEMTEYVNTLESLDSYDKTMSAAFKAYDGVYMSGTAPRLKWSITQKLDKLFDAAEQKDKTEPVILRRVQMARMSMDLSILVFAPADHQLRKPAFDRFFSLAEEIGLEYVDDTVVSQSRMKTEDFKELMSHPEKLVTRLALQWLDQHQDEQSFLLLHYFDAHDPYSPPEPFASRFADHPYAGEIAFVDECVGRVLDKLKALGLYDSTLIIITADHGEMLGEHGEAAHSYFIYESAIRVPLICKLPGETRPKRIEEVVGLVDIVPTICSLLAIEPPPHVVGEDLSVCFDTGSLPRRQGQRVRYCESFTPSAYDANTLLGLTSERWKFIQTNRPELYDLVQDPTESHNLVDSFPDQARLMQEQLNQILGEQVRSDVDSTIDLDEEAIKRIESIGYVGGADGTDQSAYDQPADRDDPQDLFEFHVAHMRVNEFLAEKNYDRARQLGHQLVEQRPEFLAGHLNLASIATEQGDRAAAIPHLQRALQLDPEHAGAHNNLGRAFQSQGNPEQAIVHFRQALRIAFKPDQAKVHTNLGNALVTLKRLDEAIGHFREALKIRPDDAKTRYHVANTLQYLGQFDEAVQHYRATLELDQNHTQALNNLAWMFATSADAKRRRPREAVELARRASGGYQDLNPALLDTLAAAYAAAGQ